MTGIKMLGCLTFLAILATLNVTDGQLSQTTKTQMRTATKDVLSAIDYGKTLLEKLKPMAGALGIFGAFLTLALSFVPSQESADMKFMKTKFAEINRKLDSISNELENIKDLVKYETQRTQYMNSANKIMFGYEQLHKFLNETYALKSCVKGQSCKKERWDIAERYVESFNIKENVYEIMKGTAGPGTVFGEPLLELLNTYYKCDINKVFDFANGVINLAYKGQHVILAHEKLTGTNQSISTAMKDWSEMAYNIRKKADDIKLRCYKDIDKYMKADIIDTKYQTGYGGNKEAAVALKTDLDKKYPWVLWTVLSYGASGSDNHYGFEQFRNMPTDDRKRVLRVIASDNGTYSKQEQILSSIKSTIIDKFSYSDDSDADSLFNKLVREIGTTTKNKLLSLVVLKTYDDLEFDAESGLFEFNDLFEEVWRPHGIFNFGLHFYFRIWAMTKSDEQIAGVQCDKFCVAPSTCERIPYTSKSYCLCKKFFYGEYCEHFDTVSLAANVDQMLTLTSRIPTVSDVYLEVEDLQAYIGSSLHNVENTIAQLQEKLMTEFQWTNLLTEYSASMDRLTYFITRFKTLNSSDQTYETQSKALAKLVVEPDGIQEWLYDLNLLIVGRMNILNENKPVIVILMEKNKNIACNTNYKEALDAAWQQLVVLQSQAYMMWASSRAILHQSSDEIASKYQQKLLSQTDFMGKTTCEITILNSATANCSGGYYMYPGMKIINQCDENYYLVGNSTVTCNKPLNSSCHACDCNPQGSSSKECDDETGKCDCSNKFYGDKCNNRDCVWSSWSSRGSCPDYDSTDVTDEDTCYRRTRNKVVQKHGEGQECIGKSVQEVLY